MPLHADTSRRTHVFIMSTRGLVTITGLQAEDPQRVVSWVCHNNESEAIISPHYKRFVAPGRGVVSADFGDRCSWMLSIDENINDDGMSWKLAAYLAHYLKDQDRLGDGQPGAGDLVILATGNVGVNGQVSTITHLQAKLEAAAAQLSQWQSLDLQVITMAPAGDIQALMAGTQDVDAENVDADAENNWEQLNLVGVEHCHDVGAHLRAEVAPAPPQPGKRLWVSGALILVAGAALAGTYWWEEFWPGTEAAPLHAGSKPAVRLVEPNVEAVDDTPEFQPPTEQPVRTVQLRPSQPAPAAKTLRIKVQPDDSDCVVEDDSGSVELAAGEVLQLQLGKCSVQVFSGDDAVQVYAVSLRYGTVETLAREEQAWLLPVPRRSPWQSAPVAIVFSDTDWSASRLAQIRAAADAKQLSSADKAQNLLRPYARSNQVYFVEFAPRG